jgi:hypothetical protein
MFNISFEDFKSPFYIHSSIVLGFKGKPSLIYRTTFDKIREPKVPKDDLRLLIPDNQFFYIDNV